MVMWVLRSIMKYGTDEAETIFDVVCPTYRDAVDLIEYTFPDAVYIKNDECKSRPIESVLVDDELEKYYAIEDYWVEKEYDGSTTKHDIFPIEYFKMPENDDKNNENSNKV